MGHPPHAEASRQDGLLGCVPVPAAVQHMGVARCCTDIVVAEQFLHGYRPCFLKPLDGEVVNLYASGNVCPKRKTSPFVSLLS